MLALFLVILSAAPTDHAPERLHVDWVAPEGCPTLEQLEPALEADVPANRTFHASVQVHEPLEAGAPWRAIVITTADGVEHTRAVEGADCARASSAAVLVITLAATTLTDREPPVAATPPPHAATPVATASEAEAAPLREPDPFSFHLRLQPLVGGNAGVFPLPGFSWGLAASFVAGHLRAQTTVATWSTPASGQVRGVSAGLTSVAINGAWLLSPANFVQLGPTAALEVGDLTATGTGIRSPQPNGVFWSSALAGLTAGFSLSKRMSAWVTAEAGLNLTRPRFLITTAGGDLAVFKMGWPLGRVIVGLEFDLPFP